MLSLPRKLPIVKLLHQAFAYSVVARAERVRTGVERVTVGELFASISHLDSCVNAQMLSGLDRLQFRVAFLDLLAPTARRDQPAGTN